MDILQIVILGLVQAVTEWLPLSSKTMDTLVYTKLFGGNSANVIPILLFLHIGTLLAATLFFRKEIVSLAKKFLSAPTIIKRHENTEIGFLFTSIFFTALLGFPILIAETFFLGKLDAGALLSVMGAGLILTGFLLTSQHRNKWRTAESATWKDGVLTGLLQGLSALPGVSRAGTSTTGLIWRGFDAESSFHLSFLLSIPTVFLAEMVLWAYQIFFSHQAAAIGAIPLIDGLALALSSFVFGYITIGVLIKLAHRINVAWLAFAFGIMMVLFGLVGIG